jgi:molecular chaperone DnaK
MTREVVLGIDFGTSYTSAGVLVGGRVELVHDQGDPAIPSVVHVPRGGDLVVGHQAVARLAADPTSTIASIKRHLGDATTTLTINGAHLACEQIAAAIFIKVRDLAERRFGGTVRRAVVAIPAAATPAYVASLQRAAKLAHIEIVQVVSEPIAGALSLGLHEAAATRRVVVCDFGGGTFDVTAVKQDGLRFHPVATVGDQHLGGDDLDTAMANAIAGIVYGRARFNILDDHVRRAQLLQRCESVKRALSTQPQARLSLAKAYIEQHQHRSLDLIIERAWIEPIWMPLIARAVAWVSDVLARARWDVETVERVVLIGGSSQVPLYRAAIENAFGAERVMSPPNAGLAVATGTTLLTARFAPASAVLPTLDDESIDIAI